MTLSSLHKLAEHEENMRSEWMRIVDAAHREVIGGYRLAGKSLLGKASKEEKMDFEQAHVEFSLPKRDCWKPLMCKRISQQMASWNLFEKEIDGSADCGDFNG